MQLTWVHITHIRDARSKTVASHISVFLSIYITHDDADNCQCFIFWHQTYICTVRSCTPNNCLHCTLSYLWFVAVWYKTVSKCHDIMCMYKLQRRHMNVVTSRFIGNSTVWSTLCSDKQQNFELLSFVRGIHRWPVHFHHRGTVMQEVFAWHDVVMCFRSLMWKLKVFISPPNLMNTCDRLFI